MLQARVAFSLCQRVLVLVAALIVVGWGTVLGSRMPIDLLPEIC